MNQGLSKIDFLVGIVDEEKVSIKFKDGCQLGRLRFYNDDGYETIKNKIKRFYFASNLHLVSIARLFFGSLLFEI
jgi:hypothetical protein